MTASGALAFDGRGWPWEWPLRWMGLLDPKLFTIVTKTLTRYPRKGHLRWTHPWSVVKTLNGDGIVNAIGLTNGGIEWWLQEIEPTIPLDYHIVVSLEADQEKELCEMLGMIQTLPLMGVELNLSCPNTASFDLQSTQKVVNLCRAANTVSHFPLIAKLSWTHDYKTIAAELETMKKIQAISINSIPWKSLYPEKKSPLEKFEGGGVSGKHIQKFTWKMVEELSKISRIPVIGPSVWNYGDIQKIFDLGAKAVSFGSIFVKKPWRPTLFIKKWKRTHTS